MVHVKGENGTYVCKALKVQKLIFISDHLSFVDFKLRNIVSELLDANLQLHQQGTQGKEAGRLGLDHIQGP